MAFMVAKGSYQVGFTDGWLKGIRLEGSDHFIGGIINTPMRIYYPAQKAGRDRPAVTEFTRFPAIIYTHGRMLSTTEDISRTNHLRAQRLIHPLVSHGYVVISPSLVILDQFQSYRLRARARIVNTAARTLTSNTRVGGRRLKDLVDKHRVGTWGHSRGGAAAIAGHVYQEKDAPTIRAVGCICNVEGSRIQCRVPLLAMYASLDDDVRDGSPIKVYERSTAAKTLVYVNGAGHYHFTDDLTIDLPVLSRTTHHNLAVAYYLKFFERVLRGKVEHDSVLTGEVKPHRSSAEVAVSYQSPSARVIDRFDTPFGGFNALGGQRFQQGMSFIQSNRQLNQRELGMFHESTRALVMTWPSGQRASYSCELKGISSSSKEVLCLRISPWRLYGYTSPLYDDVRFSVVLVDRAGREAKVPSNATGFRSAMYPSANPYHDRRRREVLGSLRLPMHLFKSTEPNLDLKNLYYLKLIFQPLGSSLAISNLTLEKEAYDA